MPDQALPTVRVAIYARVSSEEQREGQTIDSQIAELERFARAQDWIVADIYKDEGWSGAVLVRPELDRLRDDASKKQFDVALFNDVDRLARDVSHLGVIKRDLERKGIQVRFRKLPAEQSPTANLMVNILGSFAEFEREMIVDRTRRGRRHKVEVRQQFLGSIAPYGYRYVTKNRTESREGRLEILPEQALFVRQMFQWVEVEGLSARKVVRRLTDLGIPPAKSGRAWGKSTVLRILRCEAYAGIWYYNKSESYAPPATGKQPTYRRSVKYKHRPRPREEWIGVKLPEQLRIIDRAQWERVQSQINRNRIFSVRNAHHTYLLKGLVQCGGCKARYVGDPNHGKYYYRCHRRCKQYPAVREEVLSQTVWDAVEKVILHPNIVIRQAEQRAQKVAAKVTLSESEEKEITLGLDKLADEEHRILEAYRMGILTPIILGRELEQLKARRSVLVRRQAELKTHSRQSNLTDIRRTVSDFCQKAVKRLSELTVVERQRFLQLLIEVIIFRGNEITIKGIIPSQGSTAQGTTETEIPDKQAEIPIINGIADCGEAHHGRNSVKQIAFELAKSLPKTRPLWSAERLRLVRRLAERKPKATLKELCERMQEEQRITVSISSMARAVKRLNPAHKRQGSSSM